MTDLSECQCFDCVRAREHATMPTRTEADYEEAAKRFAHAYLSDWARILPRVQELTGLSLTDTLSYMTFLQCHEARLAAVALTSFVMQNFRPAAPPGEEWKAGESS